MIVWAAVLEVQKPRRGLAPLVLLSLAGLLRPEAWLMAGIYWLWLALGHVRPKLKLPGSLPSIKQLFWFAVLVISAPVIWLVWDWIVTGDALYSIHSTARSPPSSNATSHSLVRSPRSRRTSAAPSSGSRSSPDRSGSRLAFWVYRLRMLMLAALGFVGVITYLLIAVAGLSVIPRYLVIPSIVLCFGVAFAVIGWERLEGNARKLGIALAILTVLLGLVRAPSYLDISAHSTPVRRTSQLRTVGSTTFSTSRRSRDDRELRADHRLHARDRADHPVQARTVQGRSPDDHAAEDGADQGTVLIQTSALDPLQMTVVDRVLRRQWTGFHQPGFKFRGENRAWIVYSTCGAKK